MRKKAKLYEKKKYKKQTNIIMKQFNFIHKIIKMFQEY